MKVVALVALSIALAADASAHCFTEDNSWHAHLIRGSSSVPSGSGLLVEWGPRGLFNPLARDGNKPKEDPKAWKLSADGTAVEFVQKDIAPGLFLLVPTTMTGKLEVTAPSGDTRTITFTSDALPALLAAPRITSVKRSVTKGPRGEKQTRATAMVKGDYPEGAIVLVAYVGNKAVAWARTSGQDEKGGIQIFHDEIPCWSQPNSAPAPKAGTKVQFAWVDRTGRLSKKSAAIAVK